jgi:hypothetical protein
MAFIGIVPSEHSTGDTIRRGKIKKTGNSHLRCALVEAAGHYCHKARMTRGLMKRQEGIWDPGLRRDDERARTAFRDYFVNSLLNGKVEFSQRSSGLSGSSPVFLCHDGCHTARGIMELWR